MGTQAATPASARKRGSVTWADQRACHKRRPCVGWDACAPQGRQNPSQLHTGCVLAGGAWPEVPARAHFVLLPPPAPQGRTVGSELQALPPPARSVQAPVPLGTAGAVQPVEEDVHASSSGSEGALRLLCAWVWWEHAADADQGICKGVMGWHCRNDSTHRQGTVLARLVERLTLPGVCVLCVCV